MHNPLLAHIERILISDAGARRSEYQLLRCLVEEGVLQDGYSRDNLGLFQAHFLVMNALYQLRPQLLDSGQGYLVISPLAIYLQPPDDTTSETHSLAEKDHLSGYYLDWDNLRGASEASVNKLLNSFWDRFSGQDDRQQALALLELEEPVTLAQIKHRYRQQAMRWHPDRGGDHQRLAELNEAMAVLRRHYS